MKLLALTALFLTVIPKLIFGQEAPDAKIVAGSFPGGACINPIPAYSAWIIGIKYGGEAAPDGGASAGGSLNRPVSYFVQKTNGTIYEKVTGETGSLMERWYLGGVQYTKRDGHYNQFNGARFAYLNSLDFEYLPASGILGFDWVTGNNFIGFQKVGDHTFLVFKDALPSSIVLGPPVTPQFMEGTPAMDPGPAVEVIAWIDMETRLPVKLQVDRQIRTFTFQSPPTSEIQLPSELTAMLEREKQAVMKADRAAARPY